MQRGRSGRVPQRSAQRVFAMLAGGALAMGLFVLGGWYLGDRVGIGTYNSLDYASEKVPCVYDADGDGTSDMLGIFMMSSNTRREREVMLVDGKTFQRRWGVATDAHCVAGSSIVAVRERTVAIVDGLTGAERMTAPLSDFVQSVCIDGTRVSVKAIDDVVTTYDLATGKPSSEPAVACDQNKDQGFTSVTAKCFGESYPHAAPLPPVQTAPRFTLQVKEKGTPEVTLQGLDAQGNTTYSTALGAWDVKKSAVVGNRLATIQGLTAVGYDLATGAEVWRTEIGYPYADAFVDGRIYVVTGGPRRSRNLTVYDANDGKQLQKF